MHSFHFSIVIFSFCGDFFWLGVCVTCEVWSGCGSCWAYPPSLQLVDFNQNFYAIF